MTRLSITPPYDYLLHRDACSYGYFILRPNHWDPETHTLSRTLDLDRTPVNITITQPSDSPGSRLAVRTDRTLTTDHRKLARAQITRMLHLTGAGSAEAVADFHRADPRFKPSGRGRLFRSPTLFEDIIKTVTSCNVAWPSTITMNRRLCEVINPAFPRPTQLARRQPHTLRARCRVGYRDQRIVQLAKLANQRASIIHPSTEHNLTDPAVPDAEILKQLQTLPGIGPYAAANILQLLGRYTHLPIDTETHRHARTVLAFNEAGNALSKRIEAHYRPLGPNRFRSYWFELWTHYESKRGPAHTWERDTTGATFTASALK